MKAFPPQRNVLMAAAAMMLLATVARGDSSQDRTVDAVVVGDEASERAHQLKGERSDTQRVNDRLFRFANTNGWFSWELKVLPDVPQELNVGFGGGRRTAPDTVDVEWKPVTHPSGYGCEGNCYNRTTFEAVDTDGLRLDVQLPEKFSSGILQWKVE